MYECTDNYGNSNVVDRTYKEITYTSIGNGNRYNGNDEMMEIIEIMEMIMKRMMRIKTIKMKIMTMMIIMLKRK